MVVKISNKWTDKEVKILEKCYDNNDSIDDILKKLDRTKKAIKNKAYRMGITNNNTWTKEEVEKLVKLYNNNEKRGELCLKEFAEEVGRLESNVCRKARKLGLTKKNRKLDNNFINKLKKKGKDNWDNLSKEEKKNIKDLLTWYAQNEHPKGMLGKNHSEEFSKKQSKRMKENWSDPDYVLNSEEYRQMISDRQSKTMKERIKKKPNSIYSNSKQGKREDLNNTFFRSAWEANYARYLNYINVEWDFEPKTFIFEQIKRGTRSYTPDFYLTEEDRWIEVKGWFSSKDKTKLKRFKKYYPKEFKKITLVIKKAYEGKQAVVAKELGIDSVESYKEIKDKFGGLIENWE